MLFGKEHVERYRATDGEEGHDWLEGSQVLLLTTTGHKSGEERTTPLIYGRSGDDVLVVARRAALTSHPRGFGTSRPTRRSACRSGATVSVRGRGPRHRRRSRRCGSEMLSHWKHYDAYQRNTDREIPVVVLERI